MRKFCIGLFWLPPIIAFDLASILGGGLLLISGIACLDAPGAAPTDLIVLMYQFNVLLMPTLAPVCLWFW